MIILLGDRFEIFSAPIPAVLQDIPSSFLWRCCDRSTDEKIRHAVTKLQIFIC